MNTATTDARIGRYALAVAGLNIVGDTDETGQGAAIEALHAGDARYLLVESNVGRASHMQSHFLSVHATPDAAGDYHVGQEYREDWTIESLLDLDTGAELIARERIEFTTAAGEVINHTTIERDAVIEALRDAARNDSPADAVEFVSSLVGFEEWDQLAQGEDA
jgi:hypothetical protein